MRVSKSSLTVCSHVGCNTSLKLIEQLLHEIKGHRRRETIVRLMKQWELIYQPGQVTLPIWSLKDVCCNFNFGCSSVAHGMYYLACMPNSHDCSTNYLSLSKSSFGRINLGESETNLTCDSIIASPIYLAELNIVSICDFAQPHYSLRLIFSGLVLSITCLPNKWRKWKIYK